MSQNIIDTTSTTLTKEKVQDLLSLYRAGCPNGRATAQDRQDVMKVLDDWTRRHVTQNKDANLEMWYRVLQHIAGGFLSDAASFDESKAEETQMFASLAVGIMWLVQEYAALNDLLDTARGQTVVALRQRDVLAAKLAKAQGAAS